MIYSLYAINQSDLMAKYRCLQCGRDVKPMIMEPATKVCPKCGSVRLEKLKKE